MSKAIEPPLKKNKPEVIQVEVSFTDIKSVDHLIFSDVRIGCADGKFVYANKVFLVNIPFYKNLLTDPLSKTNKAVQLQSEYSSIVIDIIMCIVYGYVREASEKIREYLFTDFVLLHQFLTEIHARLYDEGLMAFGNTLSETTTLYPGLYTAITKMSQYGKSPFFTVNGVQKQPLEVFYFRHLFNIINGSKKGNPWSKIQYELDRNALDLFVNTFDLSSKSALTILFSMEPTDLEARLATIAFGKVNLKQFLTGCSTSLAYRNAKLSKTLMRMSTNKAINHSFDLTIKTHQISFNERGSGSGNYK